MNKKLLLLFALVGATSSFSQTFNQSNEPMIGDTKTLFVCDSFASNYAAITGNAVTWDYGTLTSYVGETRTIDMLDATTTPFAGDFPSSTNAVKIENFTYSYGNSTTSASYSDGYVIETTDFGDIKAVFSSNSQKLMNYPAYLGASVMDSFAGNLYFTYSGIPQSPMCTGVSYSTYDGVGTLIQANGVPLTNVSRFHVVDTLFTTIPLLGAAKIIRTQFQYFDLSASNHLPVFMHVSAQLVSGFPDPLFDVTLVLSEVSGIQSAGLNDVEKLNLTVYPNPAKDQITIQGLPFTSEVTLIGLTGQRHRLTATGNVFALPELANGMYFLEVKSNDAIQTETLIIE